MQIIGTGIDIVECERIEQMIRRHGEGFLGRVYTPGEVRYCQARRRAVEHFAGRWAAKEAVLKALGTGWRKGMAFTDVEVRNTAAGSPKVTLRAVAADRAERLGIRSILITISHCRQYATAHAIAVGDDEDE
jgi:holo-[acyl-carrier protein] synthase